MTRSKAMLRPHLIVFVLYAAIVMAVVGFGLWMIWSQEACDKAILSNIIGLASIALGLGFGRNVSELCSVKIDDKGITQWKIMRRSHLFFCDNIDWGEDIAIIDNGIRMVLKSASTVIRVNLSFFNDMNEASAFILDRAVKRNGS